MNEQDTETLSPREVQAAREVQQCLRDYSTQTQRILHPSQWKLENVLSYGFSWLRNRSKPLPGGMTRDECIEGLRTLCEDAMKWERLRDPQFRRWPDVDLLLDYIAEHGLPAADGQLRPPGETTPPEKWLSFRDQPPKAEDYHPFIYCLRWSDGHIWPASYRDDVRTADMWCHCKVQQAPERPPRPVTTDPELTAGDGGAGYAVSG